MNPSFKKDRKNLALLSGKMTENKKVGNEDHSVRPLVWLAVTPLVRFYYF
jgi:hypothetical protein